jgi:hypothetical protein
MTGSHLPLQSFFLALKQNGFLVTPQQVVDANRIINEFADDLRNEEELCQYLSPLFAHNQEEQQQFEELFTAHFKPRPIGEVEVVPKLPTIETHLQKHWWKYTLGALLLCAAFFSSTGHRHRHRIFHPFIFLTGTITCDHRMAGSRSR